MIGTPKPLAMVAACLREGGASEATIDDWAAALRLANEHLMGPSLHAVAAAAGRLGEMPPEVAEYLAMLHRLNGDRNAALRRQAAGLIAALNREGVEPMLLKGALTLVQGLHPDPAARMVGDLDLLVPPEATARTIETLQSLDYRVRERYPAGHHAWGEFTRQGAAGAVDLHIELIDQRYMLPAAEVWRGAERLPMHGLRAFAPAPEHALLHTLLHAQVHHLGDFYRGILRLRPLYDFATQIMTWQRDLDWSSVCSRLDRHRLRTPLDSYLLAASRLLGTRWPLRRRPSPAAELHYQRCLLQMHVGGAERLAGAWGNLRGAFARHRMQALYGSGSRPGGMLQCQLEHAWRFLRGRDLDQVMARLFRDR